ncbi:MAG: O-antigen ligase family protein [Acidimicrobiia bacterium]
MLQSALTNTLADGFVAILLVALALAPTSNDLGARSRLGLIMAILAVWFLTSSRSRQKSLAVPVLCLSLLGLTLAIAFAVAPRLALESALPALAGVGVFSFFALGPVESGRAQRGLGIALVVLAVTALILWVQGVWTWQSVIAAADPGASLLERLPVSPPRAAPGLHPNHAAFLCEIGLPLAVLASFRAAPYRHLWIGAGVLLTVVLALTGSRGGWAGAIVGVAVSLVLARRRLRPGEKLVPRWLLVALATAAVSLGAVLLSGSRPSWLFRGTLDDRFPAFQIGWRMFLDDVVTGHGPGAFSLLLDGYTGDDVYAGWVRAIWNHAHNNYIQTLLEYGLIGTSVIVAAGLLIARAAWRQMTTSPDHEHGPMPAAFIGALIALAVHSLVDVVNISTGALALLAAMAGIVARNESCEMRMPGSAVIGSASVLLIPGLIAITMPAHLAYQSGVRLAASGDWAAAAERFEQAASWDPLPAYRLTASQALIEAGSNEATLVARLREDAERFPTYGPAQLNLLIGAGDHASVDLAAARLVADELALVQLGMIQDEIGLPTDADQTYLRALRINPWLLFSPVWADIEEGADRSRQLFQFLLDQQPCSVVEPMVLSGSSEEPVLAAGLACPVGSVGYLHALMGEGRWAELEEFVDVGLEAEPDNPVWHRLYGVVATAGGDTTAARRSWAIGGLLGDTYSLLRLVKSYEGEPLPDEIFGLASTRVDTRSPVRLTAGPTPTYILGSGRFSLIHSREALPSPLASAGWVGLVTDLHMEMVEALAASNREPP